VPAGVPARPLGRERPTCGRRRDNQNEEQGRGQVDIQPGELDGGHADWDAPCDVRAGVADAHATGHRPSFGADREGRGSEITQLPVIGMKFTVATTIGLRADRRRTVLEPRSGLGRRENAANGPRGRPLAILKGREIDRPPTGSRRFEAIDRDPGALPD
jgi:hypothetical protein